MSPHTATQDGGAPMDEVLRQGQIEYRISSGGQDGH